ncbi:MAG: hypothetical protein AB7U34_02510 [Novosphingobium sp.]
MKISFYVALSLIGILIAQEAIGINILVNKEEKSIFVYEGDIILDADIAGNKRKEEPIFREKYCTYFSGFGTDIFTSTTINRGKRGLNCPYIFVNR